MQISGSIATAIATGSGRGSPGSLDCSRAAFSALVLQSIANRATGVPRPRTLSISSSESVAAPRHSSQPTISIGRPERNTARAASGSTQTLYSAAGVTLPIVHAAPPITMHRPTFDTMSGARDRAFATFVSGPSVTSTMPRRARIVLMSTSTALPSAGFRCGGGYPWSPRPSRP